MRTVVVVLVLLGLGTAGAIFLSGGRSPEARRDRVLRRLNDGGVVVRRSCGLGEIHVDGARWAEMRAGSREEAAQALSSWCGDQGGERTIAILDANSRARLGRWNGSALEP